MRGTAELSQLLRLAPPPFLILDRVEG